MNHVLVGLVAAVAAGGVVFFALTFGVGVDFAARRVQPVVVPEQTQQTQQTEQTDGPSCAELLAHSQQELDYLRDQRTSARELTEQILALEAEVTP